MNPSDDEVKELFVNQMESSKKVCFLAKEFLLKTDVVDIVSSTQGVPIAARAAESLRRLNYIKYENIITDTSIIDGRRRNKFVIRIRKKKDLERL